VELLQAQEVAGIHQHGNYHCVTTGDGGEYSARALLIATGSRYKRLDVPGETDYLGAGVHFCATCDGPFYKGKKVAVIGGGNSATEESLLLTKFAERVIILARGAKFTASQVIQEKVLSHPQIEVHWNTSVKSFLGANNKLNSLLIVDNQVGQEEKLPVDGAFIFIGQIPNSGFLKDSDVLLDRWDYIVTGHALQHGENSAQKDTSREPLLMETSIPGVFAAGDVRDGSTKQVVSAAGEGSSAALAIREYLKMV
jgi:thioredoxin reductase (NADPH)